MGREAKGESHFGSWGRLLLREYTTVLDSYLLCLGTSKLGFHESTVSIDLAVTFTFSRHYAFTIYCYMVIIVVSSFWSLRPINHHHTITALGKELNPAHINTRL